MTISILIPMMNGYAWSYVTSYIESDQVDWDLFGHSSGYIRNMQSVWDDRNYTAYHLPQTFSSPVA